MAAIGQQDTRMVEVPRPTLSQCRPSTAAEHVAGIGSRLTAGDSAMALRANRATREGSSSNPRPECSRATVSGTLAVS